MKPLILVVALLTFVHPVSPRAFPPNPGVIFEAELVSQPGAKPELLTTAIEGLNARVRTSSQGDMIYHGAKREMVIVNHGAKSVMVVDEATIKRLGQMMAQMEQMMKNMPESQRAQVEQMMRGRMGGAANAAVSVTSTGERSTQNGFATTKYEVRRGGVKTQEVWVTPWGSVDGVKEAQPVLESMADLVKDMLAGLQSFAPDAGMEVTGRIKELGGYPVVTQNFDASGQPTTRVSLKSVKRQTVAASEFEAPAGYKVQAMPQVGQMPPMGQ